MYEDSWYSYVPDAPKDDSYSQSAGHRRRQSLLTQPNEREHEGRGQACQLDPLFEGPSPIISPPTATLARRAKSYTDFYHVVRAQITKDAKKARKEERQAEIIAPTSSASLKFEKTYASYEDELLDASQEEFQVYRDQLALSERHLQGLLQNTSSALDLLAALSDSFKAVETHTTAFQAQCEGLLTEQKHLRKLGDEINEGLKYYSFLEPITRRLNSPGASRAIGDDSFVEILGNLDACIDYMTSHPAERESEVYLARYRSLLARTLNLLRIKFGDLVRENTAQALKRVPADKMTTTNAFLVQAPQTSAIGKEMEGFMAKLSGIASRLYDPYRDAFRLSEAKSYEGDYLDAFKGFIVEYATERQKIVPILLDKLLDLAERQRSAGDLARWARESIQTTLEIVVNEDSKYARTFLSQPVSFSNEEQPTSKAFTYRGPFKTFLHDIVNKACIAMQPILSTMDIPTAIELVTWLRTHYDLSSIADIEGDDYAATTEEVPSDAELKSRLSNVFKDAISKIVFGRMNEVLLRDIEKYSPKPEDLVARPSTISPSQKDELNDDEGPVTDGIELRAAQLLGPGLSNAFPPVKTAVRLLMIFNDLTHDSKAEEAANEIAYNIMHQTCQAIMRAAEQVTASNSQVDGSIFAIKNLVLLKNVVLAYEISGSRRAASINFDQMWATFEALRNRGELFNVQAYYKLLWNGQLLPRVVENVEDARLELDGLMRTTITRFREECADKLTNKKSRGPVKDSWKVEAGLKEKLKVMFSEERELRDNLWAAVEETVASKQLLRA